MKYRQFIFESYEFEPGTGALQLHYSLDKTLNFTESYLFNPADFPFVDYNPVVLDRALQLLFLVAGVSYYKTFLPADIKVNNAVIDQQMAEFLGRTYQKGLGEFYYRNQLDPRTPVNFAVNTSETQTILNTKSIGMLLGLGGGKDSLVSAEILRGVVSNLTTWSLNHRAQLTPLTERVDLPHFPVERKLDMKLAEITSQGAYNGHVPISAIFACTGVVLAILTGKQDIVTSNERSANEPTLTYQGTDINHQYSKSLEFEQDFQIQLRRLFGETIRYYSFLRPLSELKIAEIFANGIFEKYKDVFSSCNHAYKQTSDRMFWCGECPKCAFVFLALTPFLERNQLETLFHGKNLLLDSALVPVYQQLLGVKGEKPLECVGEIKESRAAMRLAQEKYPELKKYEFDLPGDYDFGSLEAHSMPPEIFSKFDEAMSM